MSGQSQLLEADMDRRLDMLVRQGLMSQAKLPILKKGIAKLNGGKALAPNEREAVSSLLNSFMFIVLGDDTVFNRAKQHTQRTKYQTEDADPNGEPLTDEEIEQLFSEDDFVYEEDLEESLEESYKISHKSYTDAVNHAFAHHAKSGLSSSDDDRMHHVGINSKKPSEGKTTRVNIPATHKKTGKKHMVHMQVYNKGGSHPYELNTYSSTTRAMQKEEVEQVEEGLPPHLKKILDQKGNIDPKKVSKEVHGGKKSDAKVTDVTPKGYGPKEEVELGEKVEDMSMGEVIKDFQKSDAPQFKGKSKEKKREMAIAAKLSSESYASDKEEERMKAQKAVARLSKKKSKEEMETDPGAKAAMKEEVELDEVNANRKVIKQPAWNNRMKKKITYVTLYRNRQPTAYDRMSRNMNPQDIEMVDASDKKQIKDLKSQGFRIMEEMKKDDKKKSELIANPKTQQVKRVTPSRAKYAVKKGFVYAEEWTDDELDALFEMDNYKAKFQAMLKKTGKTLASMSDEEKKKFFNTVDAAHAAKNEDFEPLRLARFTEVTEEVEQIDEVNVNQIKKDIDSGMSHDAVIGKHANKRTTNTDAIRKVIKQHAWNNRMKKEEVEQIDEISAAQAARRDYAKDKRGLAPTKKDKPDMKHDPKKDKSVEHIVPQLRKAMSVGKEVTFQDGKSHKINSGHAAKFLNKYMNSKPAEKEQMQSHAHKSLDHFKKHV